MIKQRRLLLCTDMDRTLIPNGTQPEHPDARHRFRAFCSHDDVVLAYVTGRHSKMVQKAIKNYQLPEPDFAITDVGSKIFKIEQGKWLEIEQWQQEIGSSWNGHSSLEIKGMLSSIDELLLQESDKQNIHKVSYYLPLFVDQNAIIERISALLKPQSIKVSILWSIDELKNIGLIDVLPENATKLHAIEFLQKQLAYQDSETLFAGDSGNDLPVLISHVQSVLVDNASDEIKTCSLQMAQEKGHQDSLYLAKPIKCGMNANYSAGVLEGVAHFAPQFAELLQSDEQS
jgi:sucrose-6F-phosphate phosphohydrolase